MKAPLLAGCVGALATLLVVQASGCGTDAVGVSDCRDIEYARCEAGQYCDLVDDVDACKRFYRDQCLHGLASDNKPGGPVVKDCVTTIKRAGECARQGIEDLALCRDPTDPVSTKTYHTKPCEIVREPEGTVECEFLYKPVVVPEAGPDADAAAETSDDASDGAVTDASAD